MKRLVLFLTLLTVGRFSYGQMALNDYNKAVDLINDSQVLIGKQQYSKAIQKLEAAIKLDSLLKDPYVLLYKASYYSDDTELAKLYLKKAKAIFLKDDEIVYYLAKLYQSEKDYARALTEFTEAIEYGKENGEDYPTVYDCYASRGVCYLIQNKYEEALKDLDYALTLNKTKGSIYANRGIALYKLKRKDEACENWIKANELGVESVMEYLTKYCK